MDYNKIYAAIIEKSMYRQTDHSYYERHHILPKCVGGNNDKTNITNLTYREHFLCHWLLIKIYPDNFKLKAAFAKMLGKDENYIISSYMFEAVKRNLKDVKYPWLEKSWAKGPWNKGKKGEQVPWNKGKKGVQKSKFKGIKKQPLTESTKEKISQALQQRYQTTEHHTKGQVPWNKGKKTIKQQCQYCNKMVDRLNLKKWHGENCKAK